MHNDKEAITKRISLGLKKTIGSLTTTNRKIKYGRSGTRNSNYKDGRCLIDRYCSICGTTITRKPNNDKCKSCSAKERCLVYKNPFSGKHHTEETKAILRKNQLGKLPPNSRMVSCDGVIYDSLAKADKAPGFSSGVTRFRVLSSNKRFKSFVFVN